MKPSPNLTDLVNRMPDLDKAGKLTGPEPSVADAVYAEIFKNGLADIIGLIDMLVVPDRGDDFKVRYLLHGLALYVCRPEGAKHRPLLLQALTSQLGGDRLAEVQMFLIRQLQVAGEKDVVNALGALLLNDALCEPATQALIAIGDGAAGQFRQTLPKAKGKNRLTIMQALGVLRDAESTGALRAAVGDQNREIRLAAVWGLANIGDAEATNMLLKAADVSDTYERTQATKACLILAEKLLASGRKQEAARIYTHLHETRTDPSEQYVRETAGQGLAAAR